MKVFVSQPRKFIMEQVYSNKYGSVKLELVTEYSSINSFRSNQKIVKDNSFSMEVAEQLTLLTEHVRTQICFHYPLTGQAYIILHDSPSTAALCKVSNIEFRCSRTAKDQIEYCHKLRGSL